MLVEASWRAGCPELGCGTLSCVPAEVGVLETPEGCVCALGDVSPVCATSLCFRSLLRPWFVLGVLCVDEL